jgi:CheY-like chemotaxis protein
LLHFGVLNYRLEQAAMNRKILLASRDEILLSTRRAVLTDCGHSTVCTTDLSQAMMIALDQRPDLIILGHTFKPEEQAGFVETLKESLPGIHVLCLRLGVVEPQRLLKEIQTIFSGQPGGTRVHLLDVS